MGSSQPEDRACDRCLARSWLVSELGGHLDRAGRDFADLLGLPDDELIAALAPRQRAQFEERLRRLELEPLRARARALRLSLVCSCDREYPARLRALRGSPAVLHVAGGLRRACRLLAAEAVALVGARRASAYGLEMARSLGRDLAAVGITVISGMALGIDSAAHAGALAAGGSTVAVLPGGPDKPYPASRRALYGRIVAAGAVISELPAGTSVRRWAPPARNRIIAALATMTVVVEAGPRSGALITASFASELGHPVGAIPGRVTSELAAGPNGLIRRGEALLFERAQDVLDELYGRGVVTATERSRPPLSQELARLLGAVAAGHDTVSALSERGFAADRLLAALSELELSGYVTRGPGGKFEALP
jgi:DNA processing protein